MSPECPKVTRAGVFRGVKRAKFTPFQGGAFSPVSGAAGAAMRPIRFGPMHDALLREVHTVPGRRFRDMGNGMAGHVPAQVGTEVHTVPGHAFPRFLKGGGRP